MKFILVAKVEKNYFCSKISKRVANSLKVKQS